MVKVWISFAVAVLSMFFCTSVYGGDWETAALTDIGTNRVEGRVGLHLDETWTAGLLATWYADEEPGNTWSAGAYAKMNVDPNATFPLNDAIPVVGDWFNLPESVQMSTYVIGKFEVITYDESDPDLALSAGVGGSIGPVTLEWIFQLLESGSNEAPELDSKATLWIGLCFDI